MAQIYHFDLYGRREDKYKFLLTNDVYTVEWTKVSPQSPTYLFSPQNRDLLPEYEEAWKITDIMPVSSLGIATARDNLAIQWTKDDVRQTLKDFSCIDPEVARSKYNLGLDARDWQVTLAQKDIQNTKLDERKIQSISYRPFDIRFTYYTGNSRGLICMTRAEVMYHLLETDNLAICFIRRSREQGVNNFFVARNLIDKTILSSADNANVAPLYIYPGKENQQGNLLTARTPNLSSDFLGAIREKLGYIPTPEAIFYYAYAIFHSPNYRQRYAEFLKIDFPRLPLTSNNELFQALSEKGEELVELHLMKSKKLNKIIAKYPLSGDSTVTEVTYKQTEQQIYINKQQYFEEIAPEVWAFKIGGYQVLDKWLKDRKKAKRSLSFDDILHYQRVVVALKETMQLMTEIDENIPSFPIK